MKEVLGFQRRNEVVDPGELEEPMELAGAKDIMELEYDKLIDAKTITELGGNTSLN